VFLSGVRPLLLNAEGSEEEDGEREAMDGIYLWGIKPRLDKAESAFKIFVKIKANLRDVLPVMWSW